MPQFHIKSCNISDNVILITDKQDIKHISTVLRLKPENEVMLLDDNEIAYSAVIEDIKPDVITTKVVESHRSKRKLNLQLDLAQSIVKAGAQEFIIQKATEIGVKNIYPVITAHTVVKLSGKDFEQKVLRWQKIANEACKQCERVDFPIIQNIINFKSLLELDRGYDIVVFAAEKDTETDIKTYLRQNQHKKDGKILLITGPEGGFSNDEFAQFKEAGMTAVTLGNLIFKAETAVINALSGVIYEYEL